MASAHAIQPLPTNVAPPAFPPDFVRRPRLIERLRTGPDRALRVIVAPPGYGKSTLIAEWAGSEARRFICVRPDDLDETIAAPDRIGSPPVVVLDDAHVLSEDALRGALAFIREALPPQSIVVIAARSEPALPLGRLRAQRTLIELRTRDLAMTPAEASALLRRTGLDLDFGTVQQLVRRTAGWPVALYLAAVAIADMQERADEIEEFRGDNHLWVEYLEEEVFAHLPRASLAFMRRASILDEVNGDVCDAALGVRRSALRLEKLAQATPLLEPLDAAHERYRFHPLLREALEAALRRREPDLIPALHGRASQWHEANGRRDAAVEHAAAAGDAERAGALMWGGLAERLTPDGIEQMDSWVEQFSPDVIASAPALAMTAACGALVAGHAEAALGHARQVTASERRASRGAVGDTGPQLVAAITALGEVDATRQAAARARRALPADSPWQAACGWLEGAAVHLGGGDRVRAARLLSDAAAIGAQTLPVFAVCALGERAVLAIEDHEWDLADDLTDEADAILMTRRCELPITAAALAAIAAVRAHGGRAAEAKRDLRRAHLALAELDNRLHWYSAETQLVLAHASLYLADVAAARTLLSQASRQVRRAGETPTFSRWFSDAWSYLDTLAETNLAGPSALTIAELRVLRFLPSCRPFRDIADQLGVSANTVKTQAHAVYRKLGAGSRSEAVLVAREAGLLGQ